MEADDWAFCGAMALTGRADGPALRAPGGPASVLRDVLAAASALAGVALPGPELLGERAATAGLTRRAPFSAGGAMQVLRCADGWLALSLPRPSDWEALPALLGTAPSDWSGIDVSTRSGAELVRTGRLLGLALAVAGEVAPGPAVRCARLGTRRYRDRPLVVDLSALWAGPLCAHLLGLAGARVVKVESLSRPDGARSGPRAFFDLLHAGHEAVALDFGCASGRDALRGLLEVADVVIEGSRPRALEQLGVDVSSLARDRCWISITGHGLDAPLAAGFGDDAAVAGGLLAFDPDTGTPAPCGDAIADPLAGAHAARTALQYLADGSTGRVDVALSRVAASCLVRDEGHLRRVSDDEGALRGEPEPPRARRPAGQGPELGEHTDAVLKELLC